MKKNNNKKTADELFAELNYQKVGKCSLYAEVYENDTFKFTQEPHEAESMVIFFHTAKEYVYFNRRKDEPYSRYASQVPLKLHLAIHQKIKELRWNDEKIQ